VVGTSRNILEIAVDEIIRQAEASKNEINDTYIRKI
jgi:hypothetical protein